MLVPVLPASTRARIPLDFQILFYYSDLHRTVRVQNRHCNSRCMDPPAPLSRRNPLYPMPTSLIIQPLNPGPRNFQEPRTKQAVLSTNPPTKPNIPPQKVTAK